MLFFGNFDFVLAGLTIRSAALVATENAQKRGSDGDAASQSGVSSTKQPNSFFRYFRGESTPPDPGSFQNTPVNLSDAQAIAALSGVASYSFEASTSADAVSGIEAISSEDDESTATESTEDSSRATNGQPSGMPNMQGGRMSSGDFQITGVSESTNYTSFSEGTAKITDGEAITAGDEGTNHVLIESELAEANGLSVGDKFVISDSEDNEVEVTIKGIYETSEVGNSMSQMFNF